jgi:hypothetical protein
MSPPKPLQLGFPPGRPIEKDCLGQWNLEWIQKWLRDCTATNDVRRRNQGMHRIPTRLLYLSGSHVKLVQTSSAEVSAKIRYATLSHRWGLGKTAVTD